MDPNGKVAVISGAASGIGRATAKLLASRGARVVIADLQDGQAVVREIEAAGGQARYIRTDVTSPADLEAMLAFAVAEFGRGDIFHNNAGIGERGEDFFAPDAAAWERTLVVNLEAVLRATRLEVRLLREQGGGGVIVNTASMGGLLPMPTGPIYATTKAGVIHFSRSLGYLGAEGIRVNAICPSFTDTPMVRAAGEAGMEMMRREVGGILEPERIAEGVLQLIEDDSRAGAVMRVTVRGGIDYTFERR